jgi:hypothetical protein
MILHTGCTLHIEDSDETHLALLLRGLSPSGAVAEALLIGTRAPDEVDMEFGHHRIYLTYNQQGAHGLIQAIEITVARDVIIRLKPDAAQAGIDAETLVFGRVENLDSNALALFSRMCGTSRTSFVYEIPVRL